MNDQDISKHIKIQQVSPFWLIYRVGIPLQINYKRFTALQVDQIPVEVLLLHQRPNGQNCNATIVCECGTLMYLITFAIIGRSH